MAGAGLNIDASDFRALGAAMHNLPADLKRNAFHAAAKRIGTMGRTQVVRRLAAYTGLKQAIIREATDVYVTGDGEINIRIRSKWIPLGKLPHSKSRKGMRVRGRGLIAGSFKATMASGHVGIFKRSDKARLPIKELHGPNPAHAVLVDRHGEFSRIAEQIVAERLMPRILHEVNWRLDKLAAR